MALVGCPECGKEVSDKASQCIGCGAPLDKAVKTEVSITAVKFDPRSQKFLGTKALLAKLAAKSIIEIGWKVDAVDEVNGLVSFTTGMTWGSFSGVSGSVFIEEVGKSLFKVTGNAKQNIRGGQLVALNLMNESGKKVQKVISKMEELAS